MTFGYRDYYDRLQDAKFAFSGEGYCKFLSALVVSDILAEVIDRHLDMSLSLNGSPEIVDGVTENGMHMWHLKVPVVLKFTHDANTGTYRTITGTLGVKVSRKLGGGSATSELRITEIILATARDRPGYDDPSHR
jgi:hypothetical protein